MFREFKFSTPFYLSVSLWYCLNHILKRYTESLKYIFFHCILFFGSLWTMYNVLINALLPKSLLCWPRRSGRLIMSYTRRVPATLLPEQSYAAINLLRLRMYQLASFHEWFSGYVDFYSDNCIFRYRTSFHSLIHHSLIHHSLIHQNLFLLDNIILSNLDLYHVDFTITLFYDKKLSRS